MNDVTKSQTGQPDGSAPERRVPVFRPVTDILETADGFSLMLEMPGVAPDDVEVSLENRVLSIRGRAGQTAQDSFRLGYSEYREGDYERVFTLSEEVDQAKIEAAMVDGVLTLTLPRAAEAKPQRIRVRAGNA